MKNKLLPLIFTALLVTTSLTAQVCGTYEGSYEEQEQKYPAFYQGLESLNADLEANYKSALSRLTHLKVGNGKKIIPVVVHVIHDMGGENISDASIQGALDILNANINGQASNFLTKTPDIFASVRGDLNVEFRLAKKDPLGNPTSGIVRVRSELTNEPEPGNAVKALSYWNSYQYLNIWTVKKFSPQDDGNTLLGYAQFPWSNRMSTDGVVLLASQMISGGTLTHECGHWLGLRHVWGDADCGDDGVGDTPPAREPNFGINFSDFPYHVGLSNFGCVADSLSPAGEMFVNYMDYSDDDDVTMFTKGQNAVMNEVLDGLYDEDAGTSAIGFREYMWSADNIAATGVSDGYLTPTCAQKADFAITTGISSMCKGEDIIIKGNKSQFGNANVTAMSWDFGDNTFSANDNANFLTHTYATEGLFDISFTVVYNETTEARATSLSDLDLSNASSDTAILTTIIVQGTESELIAMGATNIALHLDLDEYSINSYWVRNQINTDSILDAFTINPLQFDSIVDILIYLDSTFLTPSESLLLNNADSLWYDDIILGYLDTMVNYSFLFNDTTILNILTYIDSTYLSAADSVWLSSADTSWSIDGVLSPSDSIRIYFGQFNTDSLLTISINLDSTSLSSSDSLLFSSSDSSWFDTTIVGQIDTLRTYYGKYYYYLFDGYYADTLFYRGELEQTTYVAYYENTCTSTIVKEKAMDVNPTSSSNTAGSYTYSFENETDLSDDWDTNLDTTVGDWSFNSTQNSSWEWVDGVAVSGSASIMIDKDNLTLGSDELISDAYDLSALSNPAIKFSWSGAAVNTFPVNELKVYYSDDCGEVWRTLGSLTPVEVANAGLHTTNFKPEATEWSDIIMTKAQLKNDNIKFKFEYVTAGSANNFYIDNIRIGEASVLFSQSVNASKLSIYPNPTNGQAIIRLENLADMNVEVKLINILGAEVRNLFEGEIVSNYYVLDKVDLSALETGIYFVKVVANGNIVTTDKLILSK